MNIHRVSSQIKLDEKYIILSSYRNLDRPLDERTE